MAFIKEDKMIKPESQYTGMETIKPVRFIARGAFFFPTSLMTQLAKAMAPPLLSRYTPIMVPNAIMIPILPRVLPNPSTSVVVMAASLSPPTKPMTIPANSKLKKGWILNFDEAMIIKITTITREMRINIGLRLRA